MSRAYQPRVPENVQSVPPSPGEPLPEELQVHFGRQFKHDFSHVRVHTGERAEHAAATAVAQAFTVGSDIVFGEGHYEPGSAAGRRLLAHELAHVVQQTGPAAGARVVDAEIDADRAAEAAEAGSVVSVRASTPIALHRKDLKVSDALKRRAELQAIMLSEGWDKWSGGKGTYKYRVLAEYNQLSAFLDKRKVQAPDLTPAQHDPAFTAVAKNVQKEPPARPPAEDWIAIQRRRLAELEAKMVEGSATPDEESQVQALRKTLTEQQTEAPAPADDPIGAVGRRLSELEAAIRAGNNDSLVRQEAENIRKTLERGTSQAPASAPGTLKLVPLQGEQPHAAEPTVGPHLRKAMEDLNLQSSGDKMPAAQPEAPKDPLTEHFAAIARRGPVPTVRSMSELSLSERKEWIRRLIKKWWTSGRDERDIAAIIDTAPPDQAAEMIGWLEHGMIGDEKVEQAIDRVSGGDENLSVHVAQTAAYLQKLGPEQAITELESAPTLPWHGVWGVGLDTPATFNFKERPDGRIEIDYFGAVPQSATDPVAKEMKALDPNIRHEAFVLDPHQLVRVRDWDQNRVVVLRAKDLLAYKHIGEREFAWDAVNVAASAATLGASAAAVAADLGLELLMGAVNESRVSLEADYPDWGPELVRLADAVSFAMKMYDGVQLVKQAGHKIARLRELGKRWRQARMKTVTTQPGSTARADKLDQLLERADQDMDRLSRTGQPEPGRWDPVEVPGPHVGANDALPTGEGKVLPFPKRAEVIKPLDEESVLEGTTGGRAPARAPSSTPHQAGRAPKVMASGSSPKGTGKPLLPKTAASKVSLPPAMPAGMPNVPKAVDTAKAKVIAATKRAMRAKFKSLKPAKNAEDEIYAMRKMIGEGAEASGVESIQQRGHRAVNVNEGQPNHDLLDISSKEEGLASVKTRGVGSETPDLKHLESYEWEVIRMRISAPKGAALGQLESVPAWNAATHLHRNKAALIKKGAWPADLPKGANVEEISHYINEKSILLVPDDHVGPLRDHIRTEALKDPAPFELVKGPSLAQDVENLVSRIRECGVTSSELAALNKKIFGVP